MIIFLLDICLLKFYLEDTQAGLGDFDYVFWNFGFQNSFTELHLIWFNASWKRRCFLPRTILIEIIHELRIRYWLPLPLWNVHKYWLINTARDRLIAHLSNQASLFNDRMKVWPYTVQCLHASSGISKLNELVAQGTTPILTNISFC